MKGIKTSFLNFMYFCSVWSYVIYIGDCFQYLSAISSLSLALKCLKSYSLTMVLHMRALHVSANLHTTAYGWYCSSDDEDGVVGKAAKTNKKNRKGFSSVFLLFFSVSISLASVGSCQGWFVCRILWHF